MNLQVSGSGVGVNSIKEKEISFLFFRIKTIKNAYIEGFNRRFRDDCLNSHEFESLEDVNPCENRKNIDDDDSNRVIMTNTHIITRLGVAALLRSGW